MVRKRFEYSPNDWFNVSLCDLEFSYFKFFRCRVVFIQIFLYFSLFHVISLQKYTRKKNTFTSSMYNIWEIFVWNFVFKSCRSLYTLFFSVPNTPQSNAEYVHGTLLLLCAVMYGWRKGVIFAWDSLPIL